MNPRENFLFFDISEAPLPTGANPSTSKSQSNKVEMNNNPSPTQSPTSKTNEENINDDVTVDDEEDDDLMFDEEEFETVKEMLLSSIG